MGKQASELELLEHLEQRALEDARESVLGFTLLTKPDYDVNWHHRLLCETLDKFARGEIQRLIVSMPPRHGKSELVSRRLPAFIFGINPDAQIISASYGADLASRMNRDVQRIMDSPDYARIFPKTKLSGDNVRTVAQGTFLRNSDIFEIVNHKGVYRSAGVGGAITGMGANFAVIDDPIKNQEEADSPVYREKVWEWYTSTLYTRLEKQGQVLLTMTRWHEDDLAGRLLAQAKADPLADQWVMLELPAVRDTDTNELDPREMGEALWPEKYPLPRLNKIKANGSRVWNALYQQRPSAAQGNIIKREHFRYYDARPNLTDMLISVDATFTGKKTSDYVAMQVWGRDRANKYLVDQVHEQLGITATIRELLKLCGKYPAAALKLIENKANGPAIEDLLKDEVSGLVLWEPRGDKVSRLNACAPQFEGGNVYFPNPALNPWVKDLVEELVTFPNATHDDRTDACTMALLRLEDGASHEVGTIRIVRG
jgi:predicted phage terminase large subunit-like protein